MRMPHLKIKFDPKPAKPNSKNCMLTLIARSEDVVKVPTKSLCHRIISKKELIPVVYLAESLTRAMNGMCITSIVNSMKEDITLDVPQVLLEEVDDNEEAMTLIFTALPLEHTGWLSRLREQLRTDLLNDEEQVSLVKIYEEYNNTFHLPGDTLTGTIAAEHAIPTPTTDPSKAINTKSYRIPEIQKKK